MNASTKAKTPQKEAPFLKGIHDIRRFFFKNEIPIYFISATNFNLLGADEWVKGLKYISYIDCFDGQHPNVFVPKEQVDHEPFESIEDINNYMLQHPEVVDYIKKRRNGKALFLMFDEQTEALAEKLGLEICFPKASLRTHLDNKVVTTRVADAAGVKSVPNVLAKVDSYKTLRKVAARLGPELVVQTPFGDSGHTTFFISNEDDWNNHADEIVGEKEVKVMKKIRCRGTAIEACVTRHGTIVAPLMTELVGFPELTPYKGGWCGNEILPDVFSEKVRRQARRATVAFGNQLLKEGYRGYFELDFLIDLDTDKLYLGELNPRITGASSITNHAVFALADMPLFMFHLLEWMDVDYKINLRDINRRWNLPENTDGWGQMIIKHCEDSVDVLTEAPPSGIWRMDDRGEVHYARFDTHRRAVEDENEAFFLRILQPGEYRYKGADLGILVSRGRFMTDDYALNDRAQAWIRGIRKRFSTKPLTFPPEAQYGGFKLM
ncbi:biotin carboxylase [Acanthopleuribacter pedis]|uniref:ATP-grasp domain-containing protein n=1 Tax=Acanthopleuribacter pedis TaxID=442870 RepID=A0A8J7QEY0_9BACT|nr:biotin carboxylase [Acanthopleuribacter pedis]MBO1319511.1 hypothetical protein [Acanthopleuribacter pedis]